MWLDFRRLLFRSVLIFSVQIKDFLGFNIDNVPVLFVDKCVIYAQNITSITPNNLLIVGVSLFIIIFMIKLNKSMLGYLWAIIVTTLKLVSRQKP